MILDDFVATTVLTAVFQAAGGRTGRIVRVADVKEFTNLDPATVDGALDELMKAGLVMPGCSGDLVFMNAAGAACAKA